MNVLVTGGCGFIGSCFIAYSLRKYPDWKILNVDALTYATHPETAERLQSIDPARYSFQKLDINSALIGELIVDHAIDAIINFAAETHVDRSILNPAAFVTANVLGVQNLLTWAKHHKIRLVQISTDEVYGSLEPSEAPFTENSALSPNSPYAASKASADLLVLANHRTFGQDAVITRCSNNYGPFQFPEKLIPLVIANAIEGLPIPVYGDGKQVRDWIYVEDHCRAIDAVLQNGTSGEVYNIGASMEVENLTIVSEILNVLEKSPSLITFVGDRPGHDRRYGLDSTKIRQSLGWQPKSSFKDAIESTVGWYVNHEDWWKSIRNNDYFKYYENNYASKLRHHETNAQKGDLL
jgi:dTDP-glucose 4,6-dehydratase